VNQMVYDVMFVGHMCYDEIIPFEGERQIAPGSAVLCGAMAAACTGKQIAAVLRLSLEDESILAPMRKAGVQVFSVPSEQTTYSRVIHPSENVDEREMVLVRDAGFFQIADMPEEKATCVHLAGISNHEFNLDFMQGLKRSGVSLSTDMQSFVRQVDPDTREIAFRDVADKKAIVSLLDKVKLDVVEAELLTGESDLGSAAAIISSWGCPEVVITRADGVLARVNGTEYFEAFSNRSVVGRTGRGDTTFAAYLCRRLDYDPAESLKFAAALVSLKMETPGPFKGSLDSVMERMMTSHA
jgi:sugar/nucleoside kinase (ribokinase family)